MLGRWIASGGKSSAPSAHNIRPLAWDTLLPPLGSRVPEPPPRGLLWRWREKRLCNTMLHQHLLPLIGKRLCLTMYERSSVITGHLVGASRCDILLCLDFREAIVEGPYPRDFPWGKVVRCIRSPYALELFEA